MTAISSKSNLKQPMRQKQESFPVLEMTCAACATSVESMLKSTAGVQDATVNFANQTALVSYDPDVVKPADLQTSVRSIGYDLIVDVEDPQAVHEAAEQENYAKLKRRTIWALILSLPVAILGMFFTDLSYGKYASMLLSAIVIFYLGRSYFFTAWKQAKYRQVNMDTLVALSTGIAFLFSAFNTVYPEFWHQRGLHAHVYFEAAALIIAFISLGKLLEEKAKSRTSGAIKKLMGLQPSTVLSVVAGIEKVIPIEEVTVGSIIIIRPGEKIPVDGTVTSGSSFVDESMISGESIPVQKAAGEKVFAGTMNQNGSFQFVAEKVGEDTVLANIIRMVRQAQGSKAPVQRLVDRVAGIFVPVVLGISVLTFTAWMLFGGENAFSHALLTSITVLVIACPCALGLATPTAIMVGIGKGAENNILIKDAESLELAHGVNAVVLDKTGTITEGRPTVVDVQWKSGLDTSQLKNILYSMETRSDHPLAGAVVVHFKDELRKNLAIDNFENITGRGVKGIIDGKQYYVGNKKLLDENGVSVDSDILQRIGKWQSEGNTVVYFSDSQQVIALFAIADKIKEGSLSAIRALKKEGIEIHMLTWDNEGTASTVARALGIEHFQAELLPSDKAQFVRKLQGSGKVVAMVGDGINDSEALAAADVSIAMGKGSDIAMDVAKITLISSDLRSVPRAISLSKKTVRTIRQNLFWAFIYNVLGIPLAAGILYSVNGFLLDPMIAGAAMALSSVSVVGNSLRLQTLNFKL
jgi:Cu2+-exporting ATPase